jgi:F-type H+-transporting ATPase subunit delta
MSSNTAARRYAKALFELCLEQQAVEAVRADLESLVGLLPQSKEWKRFVLTPFGSEEMRSSMLNNLFKDRIHPLTFRFLSFIDAKRRMSQLSGIYQEWLALYDTAQGNLRATAITSSPLDEAHISELTKRLSKRFGKNVILTTRIDPAIIGGLKIFVADQVLDYSIETQLQILQKRLIYA